MIKVVLWDDEKDVPVASIIMDLKPDKGEIIMVQIDDGEIRHFLVRDIKHGVTMSSQAYIHGGLQRPVIKNNHDHVMTVIVNEISDTKKTSDADQDPVP